MSVGIKRRRGTTAEHELFTGLEAELTVDLTKKTVVVHDGATAGGNPLATEANLAAGVSEAKTYTDDSLAPVTSQLDAVAQAVTGLENTSVDTTVRQNFQTFLGKNIWNYLDTSPANGYFYSSGTLTAGAQWATTGKIPCAAETQYIFSAGGITIHSVNFFTGATYLASATLTANGPFTTPANCTHVAINMFAGTHTADQYNAALAAGQLEAGSVATAYAAYTSAYRLLGTAYEEKDTVSGIKAITQRISSGNLYDKTLALDGKYYNASGVVSNGTASITGKIPVAAYTQYCLSIDPDITSARFTGVIAEFDSAGAFLRSITTPYTAVTPFHTGANTAYIGANLFLSVTHTAEKFQAAIGCMMLQYGAVRNGAYRAYAESLSVGLESLGDGVHAERPYRWRGKRWAAVGTSITWYNGQPYQAGAETGDICHGYVGGVARRTGLLVDNLGINGSTIGPVNADSLINRYTGITWSGYDLITLEYPVNDYGNNIALGDPAAAANTTDFCGCLKTIIEYILAQAPTARLIVCTDPDVRGATANSNGVTLKAFTDAMINIAAQYRLTVCDWYYKSGTGAVNKASTTIDGTHPNEVLQDLMGWMLEAIL